MSNSALARRRLDMSRLGGAASGSHSKSKTEALRSPHELLAHATLRAAATHVLEANPTLADRTAQSLSRHHADIAVVCHALKTFEQFTYRLRRGKRV